MRRFEPTYFKHHDTVLKFATRCVGRRDVAEELTAEAFFQLHLYWDSIEVDRLPGWLYRVVSNRAVDYLRHEALERRVALLAETAVIVHSASVYDFDRILSNNPALKPVHQACLRLKYVHELSLPEIGQRLGISPVCVKGHLQYARRLLRKQLCVSEEPA
jgi:RNA polymerase sigma-70 factor (ECF subfamily)